jgi:hypothetical protein
MLKSFTRPVAFLLSALVAVLVIAWQTTAHSFQNGVGTGAIATPATIATAPAPPALEPAILNGKPIQVLYITRSEDTVLVRCYPGYEPTLSVRAMGSNPAADGQQEGVLTCVSSES